MLNWVRDESLISEFGLLWTRDAGEQGRSKMWRQWGFTSRRHEAALEECQIRVSWRNHGFLGGEALPVPSKLSSKMKSLAVLGKEHFNSDSVKKVNSPGHNLKTTVPWWSWVQVFPFSMIHSLISHNHFSRTCQDPNYKVRMDSSTKHHKNLDPQRTLPMDKHLMGGAGFCFYFKVQKVSCTLFRGKSGLCVL